VLAIDPPCAKETRTALVAAGPQQVGKLSKLLDVAGHDANATTEAFHLVRLLILALRDMPTGLVRGVSISRDDASLAFYAERWQRA
jgi:hypothetical protein